MYYKLHIIITSFCAENVFPLQGTQNLFSTKCNKLWNVSFINFPHYFQFHFIRVVVSQNYPTYRLAVYNIMYKFLIISYLCTCTCPFLHPEASFLPSGDQAMQRIQCLWALQVCRGVSVKMSQNLTVISPDPLARRLYNNVKWWGERERNRNSI